MSLRKSEPEAEDFSVNLATTPEAIENLRPAWRKWADSFETDIEYYLHTVRSDATILHPYVITVCHGEIDQAMLIGMVRKQKVSAALSFVRIPGPAIKVLEIMEGGRMGHQSTAIDKLIARQLSKDIRRNKIDLLRIRRLQLRSELLGQLRQLLNLDIKDPVADASFDSMLSLTSNGGKPAPVFSGKILREVRRKIRILQRAFPNKSRFKCFSDPCELDAGIRDAMIVVVTSWQHPFGYALVDNWQTRENFMFCAKQGWLRIYVLYVDEHPCAFLIGQLYKDKFQCQYAGYDLSFGRFSVGSLLTAWALESLAITGGRRVDLGEGNPEYNQRLGCKRSEDVRLDVCSPTLRGRWLNMFVATTKIARVAWHRLLTGLGPNRIAKIWRDFLVARLTPRRVDARYQLGSMADGSGKAIMLSITKTKVDRRTL